MTRLALAIVVLVAGAMLNSSHTQASEPAVSAINGKTEVMGGDSAGTGAAMAAGSLSTPLGELFGLQFDGLVGKRDPGTVDGGAGHLFWRDPASGLAGIVAERASIGRAFFNRAGIEGEWYAGRWTLAGGAGYQNGFVPHSAYTKLDLRYYPTDNVMLSIGMHQTGGRYIGRGGVEWRPTTIAGIGGLALFADAGVGTHENDFVIAGIRFYFGARKSLVRRHREDDPMNPLGSDLLDNAAFLKPFDPHPTASSSGNSPPPPPPPPPEF